MSTFFSLSGLAKALQRGIGKWLKVGTVWCGKHREGSLRSLNTFKVPEDVDGLLRILTRTSPAWAQLYMSVSPDPMIFWDQVSASAPRLRYLDLQVASRSLVDESTGWLVSAALSP